EGCLRCYGRLRRLRRLHKDLPGEGDPPGSQGLRCAPPRPRRPLFGMRRVRRGLPGLGLRRGTSGSRM
ncbi:MAG: 4Fe-4S ferredoxin, iron-sulfur binding, partial [uncultured Rubrobacteraceae bacterium]